VYHVYKFESEKRVLEAWGQHVETIVTAKQAVSNAAALERIK
jgi:hypothetical protein